MKKHFKKLLVVLAVAAFFGCETEENLPLVDQQSLPSESASIDPRFIRYLETIGFSETSLSDITETDDSYLVEGDIAFLKADLIPIYDEMEKLKGEGLQWRYNVTVTTPANQYTTFKYQFDGNIPEALKSSIREAFLRWNEIRNYRIKFTETTSGNYNTLITSTNPDPSSYAYAFYPITTSTGGGTVGDKMVITVNNFDDLNYAQQVFAAAHEIGHLIGLRHSNSTASNSHILIPGTFGSDPSSIMNSGDFFPVIPSWSGFGYWDVLAVRTLYPYDSGQRPLYTYRNTNHENSVWSENWNEFGYSNQGFGYKGFTGYIFNYQKSGTIKLYRFKHQVWGTYYMSTNPNIPSIDSSYSLNRTLGYVYSSPNSNNTPVYEYYHPNSGHFFTTNANDPYMTGSNWVGGGVAFYVEKF